MNEEILLSIASAIALAFNLDKPEQVLQIVLNMSKEGLQSVVEIVNSEQPDKLKLIAILQVVQKDLLATLARKAQHGAKLQYIKSLL